MDGYHRGNGDKYNNFIPHVALEYWFYSNMFFYVNIFRFFVVAVILLMHDKQW